MNQLPRLVRAWIVSTAVAATVSCARAQVTETPYTVAPGRVLMEVDGVRLSFDRADAAGNKYTAVGVADAIVSVGITSSFDVQAGFGLFHRETFEFGGVRDSHSGLGDLAFRMKWTFWRSEGGSAAAILPYVKIPVNDDGIGNDSVEGGFIVPWEANVGAGVVAGAMFQWDHRRNVADDGYDAYWTLTGIVQRQLPLGLNVYAEALFEASSAKFSHWAGTIGAGARWRLTNRVELDYEILRGLNRHATDWTHVLRVYWGW